MNLIHRLRLIFLLFFFIAFKITLFAQVQQNAGTITSNARYDVSVQSESKFLTDAAGNQIKTNKIRIQAIGEDIGNTPQRRINTNKKNIIGNAPPCIAKTFGLIYFTKPNDEAFIGIPAGDYTVELLFIATLD